MAQMLTPREVAERLRVDRETVYRYIRAGTLRASRVGHSYRIDAAVLDDFIGAAAGLHQATAADDIRLPAERSSQFATDPIRGVPRRLTPEQRAAAIQLLAKWRSEADDPEHEESWEFLKHALDEDRLSSRRLFS
jgi:excisionase family DNA binding protein